MKNITLIILILLSSVFYRVTLHSNTTITYVANAENLTAPNVRYMGRGETWKPDEGAFLNGPSSGKFLWVNTPPGAGDFRVDMELALSKKGAGCTLLIGSSSKIQIRPGAKTWTYGGRFFQMPEKEAQFDVPSIAPGKIFNLTIAREGTTCTVRIDGKQYFRGPCSALELGALGINPGASGVNLYSFSAKGAFPAKGDTKALFGNTFGMQLRAPSAKMSDVFAPVITHEAPTNECSVVARQNGDIEVYHITKPESESVSVMRSRDGGLTWQDSAEVFKLPGRAYYAIAALEASDGAMHVVFHILGQGEGGYRGRLYEIYHTTLPAGSKTWSKPQRVIPGYVGSIRGFIQLASGRLVLAVGLAVPERAAAPKSGPDYGWNDVVIYYSDDNGVKWKNSPDRLKYALPGPNLTRYGAIEPSLVQLKDGRVWLQARDRGGRVLQSFSQNGERWSALEPTKFISSDSPTSLLRLRDGRLVMLVNGCQFWADPRSYAMGGREVLHAAISRDDGKHWSGFREVLHETNMQSGGDRGSAYSSMAENKDGKVVVMSGQGEGKHALFIFDPDWLEETDIKDQAIAGLEAWTQYGDEGISSAIGEDGGKIINIPLKASGLCGALWNFPTFDSGELNIKLHIPKDAKNLRLCLNDHFNRIDDTMAAENVVYCLNLKKLPDESAGTWHDVKLAWSKSQNAGVLDVEIDGKPTGQLKAQRAALYGINYLRIEFAADKEGASVQLKDVEAKMRGAD